MLADHTYFYELPLDNNHGAFFGIYHTRDLCATKGCLEIEQNLNTLVF